MEVGTRNGMLTFVDNAEPRITPKGSWYSRITCLCDCGNIKIVKKSSFIADTVFSCGCVRRSPSGLHRKHSHHGTQEYNSWNAMKQRCGNPNSTFYSEYGERGIIYPDKWKTFSGFWEDMGDSYVDGLSIDRIDPDGSYCKENCRWANSVMQSYNKRLRKNSVSGKTGVTFDKKSSKWKVRFSDGTGKYNNCGLHEYLWDAILVRMQKEQEFYGYVKE